MVKPVAPILRHIEMFSGNTILGDGSVIMILDPNGIASSTGEITLTEAVEDDGRARRRSASEERVSMLLFRAGGGAPKAVPLALVARLEDIDATTIEFSNDQMVVQYRGKLMPLIPFDGGMSLAADGTGRKPVAGVLGPRPVDGAGGRRDRRHRRAGPSRRDGGRAPPACWAARSSPARRPTSSTPAIG